MGGSITWESGKKQVWNNEGALSKKLGVGK
jgi:hypothetical protein